MDRIRSFVAAGSSVSTASTRRPDIDGLRAVAVLAVILYHYQVAPFAGGFVGVDVFFAISGYLITAILVDELKTRTFSLLGFYDRRLRRIAPALFAMLALCGVASLFVYLPEDLRPVGDGILTAALGKSNIFFAGVAQDYFASGDLDIQPVLHTWSLSVELQFYLVFPGLMMLLTWRSWSIRTAFLLIGAMSLAASVWGTTASPVATFYLLPTRAWELLAGGLAASARVRDGPSVRRNPAWSWAGLALIVASALAYTRSTPFPGLAAVPPVLGTILVLRSGAADIGRPNAMLGLRPLRFVGRISYSLYLWHWPLLIFCAYRSPGPLDLGTRMGAMALSFGAATLSYRVIEQPFLRRGTPPRRKGLTLATTVAASLLVAQGAILLKQIGRGAIRLSVLPPGVARLVAYENDMLRQDCAPDESEAAAFPCRFGAEGRAPSIALWGNSFARMWAPALDIAARADGISGVAYLRSYCLPFVEAGSWQTRTCADFDASAFAALRAHAELKTVVLGGNWFAAGEHIDALGPTVTALRELGREVVVILSPPQPGFSVPRALALAALRHDAPSPSVDRASAEAGPGPANAAIEALRRRYGFTVVDPADWLCDDRRCDIVRDGVPLYFDDGHIGVSGSRTAVGLFGSVVKAGSR